MYTVAMESNVCHDVTDMAAWNTAYHQWIYHHNHDTQPYMAITQVDGEICRPTSKITDGVSGLGRTMDLR